MYISKIWDEILFIRINLISYLDLINEKTLAKSKKGVCIVNVARGGIIDEEALLKALLGKYIMIKRINNFENFT